MSNSIEEKANASPPLFPFYLLGEIWIKENNQYVN